MQLTTVICNYNTRAKLARVLGSLQATTGDLRHEIFVVDNASHDDSAAMVRQRFPNVNLIESGANLWFSGGNNLGMRVAQGDYVLILNPDTVIQPGTLQTMIAYLDTHPEAGAITSLMVFDDGQLQHNCSRFAGYGDLLLGYTFLGVLLKPWRDRRRRRMWYAEWDRTSNRAIEVAPGSCIMARRAILEQIDYFDEQLKLFFTDDDLCHQIIETGAEIHYVADATIIHDEHASLDKFPRLTQRVYFEDLLTYTRKYHHAWAAWGLAVLLVPTRIALALRRVLSALPG